MDVAGQDQTQKDVGYWLRSLARFHSTAERVFAAKDIEVGQFRLRETEDLLDRWNRIRHLTGFSLDAGRLDASIQFIRNCEDTVVIHGDPKKANTKGAKLLDLEYVGWGPQALDLVLPLMEHGIRKERWQSELGSAITPQEGDSHEALINRLEAQARECYYYAAARQIAGTLLRDSKADADEEVKLLCSYLR